MDTPTRMHWWGDAEPLDWTTRCTAELTRPKE
jgi:hypothetical protein